MPDERGPLTLNILAREIKKARDHAQKTRDVVATAPDIKPILDGALVLVAAANDGMANEERLARVYTAYQKMGGKRPKRSGPVKVDYNTRRSLQRFLDRFQIEPVYKPSLVRGDVIIDNGVLRTVVATGGRQGSGGSPDVNFIAFEDSGTIEEFGNYAAAEGSMPKVALKVVPKEKVEE